MVRIQEIYLFETQVNSPFVDGGNIFDSTGDLLLTITMSNSSPRLIKDMLLAKSIFFFDISANARADFELTRGIDDFYPEEGGGSGYKNSFELFFNRRDAIQRISEFDFLIFEKLVSRRYSIVVKINNEFRAIFQEFTSIPSTIGNLNQNLVKFESNTGFGYPYLIENFTPGAIENSIIGC